MSELLTLQDLANGHLDVKALGEAANGDENTQVVTRTGETYPSVQKAIKTLFENGGFPAVPFKTKAKLITDGASLLDGDYAWVTDDTDTNNGLYIKRSGVWVFSEFNVLKRVQDYARKIDDKLILNDEKFLDLSIDKNANVYRYTDANGEMHVTGLDQSGSVQKNINDLYIKAKNSLTEKPDGNLLNFVDDADNIFAVFDSDANLRLPNDIILNGKSVLNNLNTSEFDNTDSGSRSVYRNMLVNKLPKINRLVPVAINEPTTPLTNRITKRMPSGIVTPYGVLGFHHQKIAGFDGDFTGSEVWKFRVGIDGDLTTTMLEHVLFLSPDEPRGVVKHPTVCRLPDNRILLVFEQRLEETEFYTQYQCYSSDEGISFTPPAQVVFNNLCPTANLNTVLGTTGVLTITNTGRIIMPLYTLAGSYSAFSDDMGATWTYGRSGNGVIGLEPSIIVDFNGDLLMDMRPPSALDSRRLKAKSYDNGVTWQSIVVDDVEGATNQGAIFKDESIGAIIQTNNRTTGDKRDNYTLSFSFDNGYSFPLAYVPLNPTWYGGYSHIQKWRDGIYVVFLEYDEAVFESVNSYESSGLLILTLSEVMSNVSYH